MPIYVKSVSFYNRAALVGEFDSREDDAVVNRKLDNLRLSIGQSGSIFAQDYNARKLWKIS